MTAPKTDPKISRRARKRPPKKKDPPVYPKIVTTFSEPEPPNPILIRIEPSAFNGKVMIRMYEVTIRRVEEPVHVLRKRLLRLWRTTDRNTHLVDPMRDVARDLGISEPDVFLKREEQGIDSPAELRRRGLGDFFKFDEPEPETGDR